MKKAFKPEFVIRAYTVGMRPLSLFFCVLVAVDGCPVDQYPSGPGVCKPCPAHTVTSSLADAALSVHDCKCEAGFLCLYYKQVHASVTLLNTSLSDFETDNHGMRSDFVSGIAAAAGVASGQVHLHFTVIRLNHRRRMLHAHQRNSSLVIWLDIPGTESRSLEKLRRHLLDLHLPPVTWRVQRRVLVLPLLTGGI